MGVRLVPPGTRKRGDFRSVSLFRENLCSPGVLPELLLLLGYLPKWGETGNSLRFRERYGRRGGDGGDRLPDGPRARRERLGGQGGRTARSPGPIAATRRRRSGLATWAPGTRRNRSGGVVLDHGRALPAGEKAGHPGAPVHRMPPCGALYSGRAAKLASLAVGALFPAARVLRRNCFTAPKFVCPRLRGFGCGWLPALACGPAFGCRDPEPMRQKAAPPAGTAR